MVKGVTRRVVVVKEPDPRLFEQAIFFVREEGPEGMSSQQLLEEARRAADAWRGGGRRPFRLPRPLCCAAGALATGAVWAATALLL